MSDSAFRSAQTPVRCDVCFRHCRIPEGGLGFCRGRKNEHGHNIDANYGRITSLALDPIEKKPLSRFYPGSLILSAGSYGCNLRCPFCQNHEISQNDLHDHTGVVEPEVLVDKAVELIPLGNIGIAFTYNEPMIGYEYLKKACRLAKEKGLKTVVVTAGCVNEWVLDEILDDVDAFNIDLKGFSQDYYDYVGGDLESVKAFIKRANEKAHVELTTLVVPGKNDSDEEMEKMARWIASVNPEIPLHLTRYFPRYKEKEKATPIETLIRLKGIADRYLKHVELGNV